ncbi:MAG: hypothetical protein Q9214_000006 [Letrouitia sp. 1 TL-2023]
MSFNMSEHASELSLLLVDELYGNLTSRVFGTLLFFGRLTLASILQKTGLSPRQVKHSLTVLIQQHLALWHTPSDGSQTFYEADIANSYALIRSGKCIKFVKDRFSDLASEVFSKILVLGHVRIGDLVQANFPTNGSRHSSDEALLLRTDPPNHAEASNDVEHQPIFPALTINTLYAILADLLTSNFLTLVHESHLHSEADNRTEAERLVPYDNKYRLKREAETAWGLAVNKKLDEWKNGTSEQRKAINHLKSELKRPLDDPQDDRKNKRLKSNQSLVSEAAIVATGLKRLPEDPYDDRKRKRLKSNQSLLSEAAEVTTTQNHAPSSISQYLGDDFVVQVNHEKFAVLMRNQHLLNMVEQSIGTTTAQVFATILQKVEPSLLNCKGNHEVEDEQGDVRLGTLPQVSTNELAHLVGDLPELANSIAHTGPDIDDPTKAGHHDRHQKSAKTKSDTNGASVKGGVSPDEEEALNTSSEFDEEQSSHEPRSGENGIKHYSKRRRERTPDTTPDSTPRAKTKPRTYALRQHLLLLAEHPHHFVHHVPQTDKALEKWAVSFRLLSKELLQKSLFQAISSRFGPLAGRLTRILYTRDNKKFDEKELVLLSLTPQKTTRKILQTMHRAGYLELQEVPKDNQRKPSTTMFLWYFDPERCRSRVIEETYQAMARCLQRAAVEKEGFKLTIQKASRTDVVGKEDKLLGEGEREALRQWREKEDRIWGQISRMDELVAALRDFE